MNTRNPQFLLALGLFAGLIAAPEANALGFDQTIAVLGNQSAHVAISDPAVQKALELLIKQPPKSREGKLSPNRQDNPLGSQPQSPRFNKALILGGPDIVPM